MFLFYLIIINIKDQPLSYSSIIPFTESLYVRKMLSHACEEGHTISGLS